MKQVASILLLSILFFNWIGYRFFASYMEDKANARLESRLDNDNYDESQLISIKVPANHLAYYNNSKQFERVDGAVEINGIQYQYVKKRLYNDSFEYLCIPNNDVTKLRTARDDFFKLVNDLQQQGPGKKSAPDTNTSKNFLADYYLDDISYDFCTGSTGAAEKSVFNPTYLAHCCIPVAEQPPDHC
ncbi:MAG TPA: hypothetical protein VKR53_19610 [Puia sp.]|nr:hypothetical protein [Puia sp.]